MRVSLDYRWIIKGQLSIIKPTYIGFLLLLILEIHFILFPIIIFIIRIDSRIICCLLYLLDTWIIFFSYRQTVLVIVLLLLFMQTLFESNSIKLSVDERVIELNDMRVFNLLHHLYFINHFSIMFNRDVLSHFNFFQGNFLDQSLLACTLIEAFLNGFVDCSRWTLPQNVFYLEVIQTAIVVIVSILSVVNILIYVVIEVLQYFLVYLVWIIYWITFLNYKILL